MKKVKILGVQINDLNPSELNNEIIMLLESGQPHLITTVNPEILLKSKKDPEYKKILNSSSLSLPDGIGLIYASAYLKNKIKNRITGNDLIEIIARLAARKNVSLYLLGALNNVADKAGQKLTKLYPHLKIAGVSNGTISGRHLTDPEIIKQINLTKAGILLVAFGAPKQEKWLHKNIRSLETVKIAVGVGGAFDFLAGKVMRAPVFMRKLGLEWLWRLIRQPWRVFRIFNAVIKFSFSVLKSRKNE